LFRPRPGPHALGWFLVMVTKRVFFHVHPVSPAFKHHCLWTKSNRIAWRSATSFSTTHLPAIDAGSMGQSVAGAAAALPGAAHGCCAAPSRARNFPDFQPPPFWTVGARGIAHPPNHLETRPLSAMKAGTEISGHTPAQPGLTRPGLIKEARGGPEFIRALNSVRSWRKMKHPSRSAAKSRVNRLGLLAPCKIHRSPGVVGVPPARQGPKRSAVF